MNKRFRLCRKGRAKLKQTAGLTLTEMLCTVLILLLISGLLAVGAGVANGTYRSSMADSQAQTLCSTLTAAFSDKLRFCGSVTRDGNRIFIQDVGSVSGDADGEIFRLNEDGQVVLDEQGEKKLLGAKAYPRGLRVDDLHMEYDETTQIFTISFLVTDRKGRVLAGTDFDVQRINNKTGS